MTTIDQVVASAQYFIDTYGWFFLLSAVCCFILWRTYKQRILSSYAAAVVQEKKFDNSDFLRRQEAMDMCRQRLQEKYNAEAALHAEQQLELERKRAQQKLEQMENQAAGGHQKTSFNDYRPTNVKPAKKKKTLRDDDYNPLMGDGGSCGIRPSRGGRLFGGSGSG